MNIFLMAALTAVIIITTSGVLSLYKDVVKDKQITTNANEAIEKIDNSLKYKKLNNLMKDNNTNNDNNLPINFYKNKPMTSQILYVDDNDKSKINAYAQNIQTILKTKGNNYTPSCSEIVGLGNITLTECNDINTKQYPFISFDNKGIDISSISDTNVKDRILAITNNKADVKSNTNYINKEVSFSRQDNQEFDSIFKESIKKEMKALENKNFILYSNILKNNIITSESINQSHLNSLENLSKKLNEMQVSVLATNNSTIINKFYEDKKKIFKNYIDIINIIGKRITIAKANGLTPNLIMPGRTKTIINSDVQFLETKNTSSSIIISSFTSNLTLFN